MASLKRSKLPSEHSMNRSPEIPPRFKRQKSLTSKQHTSMESSNQNANPSQKYKKSTWTETARGTSFPREGRKIVKRLFTTENEKVQSNDEKNLLKPQQTAGVVLSPMENKLFKLLRNNPGSEECYPDSGFSSDSSDTHMLRSPAWTPQNQQSTRSCYSPSFTSPCDSPSFNSTPLRNSPVSRQTIIPYFDNNNSMPTSQPMFERSHNISPPCVINETPAKNYSDSDIRTIEMLRQLERVADETDVGNDGNCNDKNSLVSHHLRMLMCAVDLYTQEVDEGIESDTQAQSSNHNQIMNKWDPWSSDSFSGLDVYCVDKPVSPCPFYQPMFLHDNASTFYDRHSA